MKKLLLLFAVALFLVSLASADESFIFKQGEPFTLEVAMANANLSSCEICTCNVSIFYPNGTAMVKNGAGTNVGEYCQYTATSNVLGVYGSEILFTDGTDSGRSTFEFEINQTGSKSSTYQGIIYIIFLIGSMFVFFLTLYGAINIPWANNRNEDGKIISFNDLKYVKLFLIVMVYILLIWIVGMLRQITANFLYLESASMLFGWIYWIFMALLYPIIVCSLVFAVIIFLESKKIRKALERGLPIR